jgi:hypothetical protein
MTPRRALQIVFACSLFGTIFSGGLSYGELWGSGAQACPAIGAPGMVLGYPACVYGFILFLIIAVVALLGLRASGRVR